MGLFFHTLYFLLRNVARGLNSCLTIFRVVCGHTRGFSQEIVNCHAIYSCGVDWVWGSGSLHHLVVLEDTVEVVSADGLTRSIFKCSHYLVSHVREQVDRRCSLMSHLMMYVYWDCSEVLSLLVLRPLCLFPVSSWTPDLGRFMNSMTQLAGNLPILHDMV